MAANLNAGEGAAEEDENMEEEDEVEVEDDDEVPEDMIEANAAIAPEAAAAERRAIGDQLPLVRPRVNAPRNLLQYLDLLSIPRQSDRNDPRIEALATEGEIIYPLNPLINFFPLSVLLSIFSYLDDLSLASVSRVCRRWRNIVQTYTNDEMWSQYTKKRWPLFQEIARVPSWLDVSTTSGL